MHKNRITVSFSPDTYHQLEGIARENGLSLSWIVRYAVEFLVKENSDGQQLMLPLRGKAKRRHVE